MTLSPRRPSRPTIDREMVGLLEDAIAASPLPDVQVRWIGRDGRTNVSLGATSRSGSSRAAVRLLERQCSLYGEDLGRLELATTHASPSELERLGDQLERLVTHLLRTRLEIESLSAELALMYEELNLLFEIGEDVATHPGSSGVWDQLLERIARVVPAQGLGVVLADEAESRLRLVAVCGDMPAGSLAIEDAWAGVALRENRPIQIERKQLDARARQGFEAGAREELLIVPLPSGSAAAGPRGAIILQDRRGGYFTAGDLKLVALLAQHVASLVRGLRSAELGREMEVARRLQRSLLPNRAPERADVIVAASCIPAGLVGGDYFDYFETASGCFGVVVGDVSGHGFGSALLMATARTVFRREAEREDSLEVIFERVNRQLHGDLQSAGNLLTLVAIVWDAEARRVCFAAAGHPAPILRRQGGEVWTLDARGLVMGLSPEAQYVEGWVPIEPGDSLVLYTDGVTEARAPDGSLYGEARLRGLLADKTGKDAHGWHEAIASSVRGFRAGREADDDTTLVVAEFR
ncbi:MAG: SpoIIE family protein phosphatase [Planctomycetota bacterium]